MKNVLVIDDDPWMRESIADLLAEVGYGVREARNGIEGLDLAVEMRPDLILLDLVMPAMDGWQFREAQRLDARLADIPVIVMSATPPEQGAALDGVAARLEKPFDPMGLLEAIRGLAGEAA